MNKKTYEKRLKEAKRLAAIKEPVKNLPSHIVYESNDAIYRLPNRGIRGVIRSDITHAAIVKVTDGKGHTIQLKEGKHKRRRAKRQKDKVENNTVITIDINIQKDKRTKKRQFFRNRKNII